MWQQDVKQAEPVGRATSLELLFSDMITLLSRHPVLPRFYPLYAVRRALVHLSTLPCATGNPAVTAPECRIMVPKDVRPATSVRQLSFPFEFRDCLLDARKRVGAALGIPGARHTTKGAAIRVILLIRTGEPGPIQCHVCI